MLMWEKIPGSPCFSVLQAMKSWAGPGNEANDHSGGVYLTFTSCDQLSVPSFALHWLQNWAMGPSLMLLLYLAKHSCSAYKVHTLLIVHFLDALEAVFGQTITYKRATSGLKVESWWHTTLWTAPSHHQLGVACGVCPIWYVCLRKATYCNNLMYAYRWWLAVLLKLHKYTPLATRSSLQGGCSLE